MVMEKIDRKRRDKKLCLWIGLWIIVFADWTLDNCVCFREPIIISAKNNEKATFIINIQPPKVYAKSGVIFFLPKYSSMLMTFWRQVMKITIVN